MVNTNYSYQLFGSRDSQPRQLQFSTKTLLMAVSSVAVLTVLYQHEAGPRNHFGVFSPHFSALMATIYFWKYRIAKSGVCRSDRGIAFILLLAAAMPFVYWQC